MFIVGGFNCYPAEIEEALLENPAIAQAAVDRRAGRAHGRGRQGLYHPAAGGVSLTEKPSSIGWARKIIANYKVPRYVEIRRRSCRRQRRARCNGSSCAGRHRRHASGRYAIT